MKFLIQLIIELIMIILLFIGIITNNINLLYIVIGLIIYIIILLLLNKYKIIKSRGEKESITNIIIYSTILMIILYLVGLKTGYETNLSVIYKRYIETSRWIYTFIIVILVEYIRYKVLCINIVDNKKKILLIFLTIIFVLIDICITTKSYSYTAFSDTFLLFALIIIPSISKNILLNYISNRYGYNPCLVYKIIMDLNVFYIPISPIINEFIYASIYLIYPYFLYTIIHRIDNEVELEDAREKHHYSIDIIIYLFAIVFVGLISREFEYSMIAIGSNSMKGCFSKGDAVIYKRYEKDILEEGNILVFTKDGRTIVHRIKDKYKLYDEEYYITKGDANKHEDNWIVEEKDIVGIVKYKIKFIGWPTVLLTEKYK